MSGTMYCKDCDGQVSKKAKICPHCGRRLKLDFVALIARAFMGAVVLLVALAFGRAFFS